MFIRFLNSFSLEFAAILSTSHLHHVQSSYHIACPQYIYSTTHCHFCSCNKLPQVCLMVGSSCSGCAYRGIDVVLEYKMVTRVMREREYNLCDLFMPLPWWAILPFSTPHISLLEFRRVQSFWSTFPRVPAYAGPSRVRADGSAPSETTWLRWKPVTLQETNRTLQKAGAALPECDSRATSPWHER